MIKSLHNYAMRNQVLLERLKAGYTREMGATLTKSINLAITAMNDFGVDSLDKVDVREFKAELAKLKSAQLELMYSEVDDLTLKLQALAASQAKQEHSVLQGLTKKAIKEPSDVWKAVKARPLMNKQLDPFIRDWATSEVENVGGMILQGYFSGSTIGDMTRKLRGTKKNNYQDGQLAISGRNAKTITRTATQHVANSARHELYVQNDDLIKEYTYLATLDGKTSAICRGHDGEDFVVGKGPLPPLHPNCRSTTIPKLGPEFDFLDEGATRSSKDGYVPANENYYDWLKQQDAEFQDEALGPTRGKLLRDGGLTADQFKKLELDKNFEPLTLAEMKAKAPSVFRKAGFDVKGEDPPEDKPKIDFGTLDRAKQLQLIEKRESVERLRYMHENIGYAEFLKKYTYLPEQKTPAGYESWKQLLLTREAELKAELDPYTEATKVSRKPRKTALEKIQKKVAAEVKASAPVRVSTIWRPPTPKTNILKTQEAVDDSWWDYDTAQEANEFLRSKGRAEVSDEAKELAFKMESAAVSERVQFQKVFRGMAFEEAKDVAQLFPKGQTIELEDLWASSAKEEIASIYVRTTKDNLGGEEAFGVMLEFLDNRGVQGHASLSQEWAAIGDEIILARGSRYKVSKITQKGNDFRITLERDE